MVTGIGSAIKAAAPHVRVLGAEPETASPYAHSLGQGAASKFPDGQASFVDGAGGQNDLTRLKTARLAGQGIAREHLQAPIAQAAADAGRGVQSGCARDRRDRSGRQRRGGGLHDPGPAVVRRHLLVGQLERHPAAHPLALGPQPSEPVP